MIFINIKNGQVAKIESVKLLEEYKNNPVWELGTESNFVEFNDVEFNK